MKKISLFCALALIGSTAFALDRARCESSKDVKILNNEMIDAVWNEKDKEHASKKQNLRWQGIFSVCVSKGGYIRGR
ncbi:MAG: hypothetical protein Q3967_02775 [Campylobacter sp.]|nr:hypothetical protein [Campylobacter sp.]